MTAIPETKGRNSDGTFAPGNVIWREREIHGRPPVFESAEDLWNACLAYFDWAHETPLLEDKVFSYQGEQTHEAGAKMRAFTTAGLCLYLGIHEDTWRDWRTTRPDLKNVIASAEAVIRTQKFEGAAAGLLNPSIIARDLGLADRNEITGRDGAPIKTEPASDIELARSIAFIFAQAIHSQNKETEKE